MSIRPNNVYVIARPKAVAIQCAESSARDSLFIWIATSLALLAMTSLMDIKV